MNTSKIQVLGKSSFFGRQDLYQNKIKTVSVRESLEKILSHKIPGEMIANYNEGYKSVIKGSYDAEYWLSKAALLSYARERKVKVQQQLKILCPSVIGDSPMTKNRHDSAGLNELKASKERFLNAREVVKISEFAFENEYLCNTSINLNGGKFARQNY